LFITAIRIEVFPTQRMVIQFIVWRADIKTYIHSVTHIIDLAY